MTLRNRPYEQRIQTLHFSRTVVEYDETDEHVHAYIDLINRYKEEVDRLSQSLIARDPNPTPHLSPGMDQLLHRINHKQLPPVPNYTQQALQARLEQACPKLQDDYRKVRSEDVPAVEVHMWASDLTKKFCRSCANYNRDQQRYTCATCGQKNITESKLRRRAACAVSKIRLKGNRYPHYLHVPMCDVCRAKLTNYLGTSIDEDQGQLRRRYLEKIGPAE